MNRLIIALTMVTLSCGLMASDCAITVNGNDMMQWHVLKIALGMDCDWLDYGGVNPTSENPKLKGIYQFKAKWGGGLERCNRFRYINHVPLLSLKYFPSKIYQKIFSTK